MGRPATTTATTGKWTSWMCLLAASVAAAAVVFQKGNNDGGLHFGGTRDTSASYASPPQSILEIFAKNAFDWTSSTTPAPLSTTAVLVKAILADPRAIPAGLDRDAVTALVGTHGETGNAEGDHRILDVRVAGVREWVSSGILAEVQRLCSSARGCDPNETDPEFGVTPLHFAQFWGSENLAEYLRSLGAKEDTLDSVGRAPKNMTFSGFSKYSRMVGQARLPEGVDQEERCEIPEVVIPPRPSNLIDSAEVGGAAAAADEEWRGDVEIALKEVRRLVGEGEPVVVRNALPWLLAMRQHHNAITGGAQKAEQLPSATLKYPDATSFVQAWSDRPVDVGSVPYAKNFDLVNERTTLGQYIAAASAATADAAMTTAAAAATSTDGKTNEQAQVRPPPNYVFQVDTEACVEGRELLGQVVDAALPSAGDRPLICPPASGQRGLESVHYYLGSNGTGAPNHIHSDAINLVVTGQKKWWVVTPRAAVWSRRHVLEYARECEEGGGGADVAEEYRPMQFVQKAGDLVYVPADWGHAAINLQDDTFG